MNFRRGWLPDEPEINLIPMIDILLVVVIFLMASTRFIHEQGLPLQLPQATQAHPVAGKPHEIDVFQKGQIQVDGVALPSGNKAENLRQRIRAWGGNPASDTVVVGADANVSHGQVMALLDALRQAGYVHLVLRTTKEP